jgi:hypothetical protein
VLRKICLNAIAGFFILAQLLCTTFPATQLAKRLRIAVAVPFDHLAFGFVYGVFGDPVESTVRRLIVELKFADGTRREWTSDEIRNLHFWHTRRGMIQAVLDAYGSFPENSKNEPRALAKFLKQPGDPPITGIEVSTQRGVLPLPGPSGPYPSLPIVDFQPPRPMVSVSFAPGEQI